MKHSAAFWSGAILAGATLAILGCSGSAPEGPPARAPASEIAPAAEAASGTGAPTRDPATPGTGACAGRTLQSVIDALHASRPDLADINKLETELSVGAPNFIYPYVLPDGFALVLQRNSGGCNDVCLRKEYFYFATDQNCRATQVGSYSEDQASVQACVSISGERRWNRPSAPVGIPCGAGEKISGTYEVGATVSRIMCSQPGTEATETLARTFGLKVDQESSALGTAVVTFSGTGHPKLDGVSFAAKVEGRRFTVRKELTAPATCEQSLLVDASFDFLAKAGTLRLLETLSMPCPNSAGTYCKASLSAELSAP